MFATDGAQMNTEQNCKSADAHFCVSYRGAFVPHLWLMTLAIVLPTCAEPAPLKTPEGAFDVYEWVIFVADPAQPQVNASILYPSTLPDFAGSRRTQAPVEKAAEPQPVGVIRFKGTSGKDTVDVQLTNKGAKF